MYSHNCSCLPNKKQPAFTGSMSQNFDLFRTFTARSFSNFEEQAGTMHLPVNVGVDSLTTVSNSKHTDVPNLSTKSSSIMHLVYNFKDTAPKFNIRSSTCNFSSLDRTRSNCKTYFAQYDSVSTMPLASSHLVGGFVGSKSQLGRRPSSKGVGVNMWDIIQQVISHYFGNSKSMPEKDECQKTLLEDSRCISTTSLKADCGQQLSDLKQQRPNDKSSPGISNFSMKGENPVNIIKQSYADVAKAKKPNLDTSAKVVEGRIYEQRLRCPKSLEENMSEHLPASINRDRITSECSADSEDSFIVFEYCETDDKSEDGDLSSSDDEESVLDLQLSSAEGSSEVTGSASSSQSGVNKFNFGQTKAPGVKKVRFAEGPNLAKVHTMLVWDYAYRAARRGPWETMARDSERFKYRIKNCEELLKPILSPQHRTAVYHQRFADPTEEK